MTSTTALSTSAESVIAASGNPAVTSDPSARRSAPHRGERSKPRHPWTRALVLYGTLKLTGFLVFLELVRSGGRYDGKPVWDVLTSWDGQWYRKIAEQGYDPKLVPIPGAVGHHWSVEQNSAAFFPLYPGTIRAVSMITGLGSFGAGLVVSIAASFAAAAGIYAIAARLSGHRAAVCAAGLWAVWPGSGAEWVIYSDSLFIALAAWTCHAVLTRRWATAGGLCLAAGTARPSSAPLIMAVVAAALVAAWRRNEADGWTRPLAAAVLAPLGFVGYVAWVGLEAGNPKAFFLLESDAWDHYIDFGAQTVHIIHSVMLGRTDYEFANPTQDLVGVAAILLSVILLAVLVSRRPPLVLVVLAVMSVAITLASHQFFGNVSRFLLAAFPLLLPAGESLARLKPSARVAFFIVTAIASGSYAGYALFVIGIP
jgi:hypothetical protein